jgi:hypothetical protein
MSLTPVVLLAVVALGCQIGPPTAAPASATPAPSSPVANATHGGVPAEHAGLMIIGDEQIQSRPSGEAQAQALSDAGDLYRAHPDAFGYPWIDPGTGELLISVTGDEGQALAGAHRWPAGVAWRIRPVDHSVAELETIQEAVTHLLSEGMPDADAIYQATPDHRDNRILISVTALSDALANALVARFGRDTIAVQITPGFPGARG